MLSGHAYSHVHSHAYSHAYKPRLQLPGAEQVNGQGLYEATYHWQTSYPKANCSYPAGHQHAYAEVRPPHRHSISLMHARAMRAKTAGTSHVNAVVSETVVQRRVHFQSSD